MRVRLYGVMFGVVIAALICLNLVMAALICVIPAAREMSVADGAPVTFLCGNHDFGMAAFLGCLPISGPPPFDLESTRNPDFKLYDPVRNQVTYWAHPVEGGMHYLGRRWAQGAVYTARPTMESYGLKMRPGYGEKNTGHDDSFLPPELRDEVLV